MFVVLVMVVLRVNWPIVSSTIPEETVRALGISLMSTYVVPFEVASVLLLIALVGAIIIAREVE